MVTLTLAFTTDLVKSLSSDYGNVAYQIKGNKIHKNMQEIHLPLHAPLTFGNGQERFLSENCHGSYQIKETGHIQQHASNNVVLTGTLDP